MSNNEAEVIRVFRLLTPCNQAELLALAHQAYRAENPAPAANNASPLKPQKYSCRNNLTRGKK